MGNNDKRQTLEELFQALKSAKVPNGKANLLIEILQVVASQTDCEEIVAQITEYCNNVDWSP